MAKLNKEQQPGNNRQEDLNESSPAVPQTETVKNLDRDHDLGDVDGFDRQVTEESTENVRPKGMDA